MSQKRYTEYHAPVDGYALGMDKYGMIPEGPYRGFDTPVNVSGLGFDLAHSGDGYTVLENDGVTVSSKMGHWVSRQGVSVTEDANITGFLIDSNVANVNIRTDLLVAEHYWDPSTVGGVAATYSIIKGPLTGPTWPALADATKQVVIGVITIPAGASSFLAGYYQRNEVKGLGNRDVARRDLKNIFLKEQDWAKGTDEAISSNLITLPGNGNLIRVTTTAATELFGMSTPSQEGVFMALEFESSNEIILCGSGGTLYPPSVPTGYSEFMLPPNPIGDYYYDLHAVTDPTPAESRIILFQFYNGYWYLISDFSMTQAQINNLVIITSTAAANIAALQNDTITYTDLTLTANFSNYDDTDYNHGSYAKKHNKVFVKGAVQLTTLGPWPSPTVIATLPAGYRPSKKQRFAIPKLNGTTYSVVTVEVDTAGNIQLVDTTALTSNDIVWLGGISFTI